MKWSLAIAALIALPNVASAQRQSAAADVTSFVIAANSSSGTYKKMLEEIIGVCSTDEFSITMANNGGGAPGNLQALVDNQAQAAFMHSDVYRFNADADPSYAKFQTLVALYPEQIHVLALRQTKQHRGVLHKAVDINSLGDAAGFSVGAAGGGAITIRILEGQGEAGYHSVDLGSGDSVIAALLDGRIAAGVFVGGAPLPNLQKLIQQYPNVFKLIPIDESIASRVKNIYRESSVNYAGLTNGPLKTLAPMATIVTRKYSTPQKVNAQRHFRECFYQHLDELKDNGHPAWQNVEAGDHGLLPWYDIPVGRH